jgi:RNA 2',3'-cyclic 3'-phosphodiesterase
MRLFIGIPFTDSVQFYLKETQTNVLKNATKSKMTRPGNFHLTLLFIGELEGTRIDQLIEVIDETVSSFNSFSIKLGTIGAFVKGAEEIVWMGIEQGITHLKKMHEELKKSLIASQLPFDAKGFNPHITLARGVSYNHENKVVVVNRYNQEIKVNYITLFKSHQVDGKLTYTPLVDFDLIPHTQEKDEKK